MVQTAMTKAAYDQRKAALADALDGAQQEYRKAAYREEMGEVPPGTAAEAQRGVTEIQNKQNELDAAWSEAQRVANEREAEADRRARRVALSKVDRLLAKRSEAVAAIEKLLVGLGDHVRRFDEAGEAIIQEVKPFRAHLACDPEPNRAFGEFMVTVRDRTDRQLIGGILYGMNVDLTGVSGRDSWFKLRDKGFGEVVGQRNRNIRRMAESIEPSEPETVPEQMERVFSEPTVLSEA